jgi:hypothetical protein
MPLFIYQIETRTILHLFAASGFSFRELRVPAYAFAELAPTDTEPGTPI